VRSFPDVSAAERASREQILSPIYKDLRMFQPVIARVEYRNNCPFSIVIIYVPMPPFSEDAQMMLAQKMPEEIVFLTMMMRLARRFRWTVLEPLMRIVEGMRPLTKLSDNNWATFDEVYQQAKLNLASIEQQGASPEISAARPASDVTGLAEELLTKLYDPFLGQKERLDIAAKNRDLNAIFSVLLEWQSTNKEFMIAVIEQTRAHIELLRP
jgi:hypothetical protein